MCIAHPPPGHLGSNLTATTKKTGYKFAKLSLDRIESVQRLKTRFWLGALANLDRQKHPCIKLSYSIQYINPKPQNQWTQSKLLEGIGQSATEINKIKDFSWAITHQEPSDEKYSSRTI